MLENYKTKIKHVLYKVGLRDTIPAPIINQVPIKECKEPLIDITKDNSLFFGDALVSNGKILLRESVYNKIKEAQQFLPPEYFFKIVSAYRPLELQEKLWQNKYNQTKKENPNLSDAEITRLTKAVCSDPRFGFGGHQTGGAVDVTLCNQNGVDYNMGTKYSEVNDKTKTKSKLLTPEENKNRYILTQAMQKTGFINYPGEWWHFCYGDRMWAAYSNQKQSIYGLINNKDR